MQTYTSSITLGPDTQGQLQSARISAPQSNLSALPPATFLHAKYQGLEMDTPWVKPETGPKRSGCPAHPHVQRPLWLHVVQRLCARQLPQELT